MAKRLFWLKLPEDFFGRLEIKRLRKMPGGDTLAIIYQRLLLLSLKAGGTLTFKGYERDLAEELALELDEEIDSVRAVLLYMNAHGLIKEADPNVYELEHVLEMTGSESDSAERMRRYRERWAELPGSVEPPQTKETPSLERNDSAPSDAAASQSDIEKEKEKEIRDRSRERERTQSQKESSERKPAAKCSRGATASKDDERFERFWAVYPNKKGKQNARKVWQKLNPSPELFEQILDAVEAAKRSDQWTRDEGRYIPHPTTWLNGARWEDEVQPAAEKKPKFSGTMDILRGLMEEPEPLEADFVDVTGYQE